jgi:RNA polymerase sigma-70 factor (ECF subfamily)
MSVASVPLSRCPLSGEALDQYARRRVNASTSLDEIARALDGDAETMRRLVERLRPVIHAEVGQVLFRLGAPNGWDPRQECRDLVQEVFVELLAKRGKVLRAWDPHRGSSFEGFVRLVARRHVIGVLRTKRRNPWVNESITSERLDEQDGEQRLDRQAEARGQLAALYDRLEQRLDERGMMLFHMLYVEQRAVDEVCEHSGMTREALYAWRSRLKKLLAQLKAEGVSDERA